MARMEDRPEDFVVAIDFGGTKVAVGTAGLDGTLIRSARIDTDAPRVTTTICHHDEVIVADVARPTRRSDTKNPPD